MPEHDLGTAHGKIVIDVDDRGAKKADTSLAKFEKTMRRFETQMKSMQRSMTSIENEFKKMESAEKRAESQSNRTTSAFGRASKAGRDFSVNLGHMRRELESSVMWMRRAYDAADRLIDPLRILGGLSLGLRKGTNNINAFGRAFTTWGAGATAIGLIGRKLLGFDKQMALMPKWVQNTHKFGTALLALSTAGKFLNKFLKLTTPLDALYVGLARLGKINTKRLNGLFDFFDKAPRGMIRFVSGLTIAASGIRGLQNSLGVLAKLGPKAFIAIGGAASIFSAAMEAGAKTLVYFSNVLNGLLVGVKQLSGGLLAIPGAVATLGAVFGTVKTLAYGMKKTFEDVFKAKDLTELSDALAALPKNLQEIGALLYTTKSAFDALASNLTSSFLKGSEGQIKTVAALINGPLSNGMLEVTNSLRLAKDQLFAFITDGKSLSFINRAFQLSSQTVGNLSKALIPALAGLRDIASVGLAFVRDMSVGAKGLTDRFAEWAAKNKENGNLMRWMTDAVKGAKDLAKGLWDATKAVWSILTAFANDSGENALARFADQMERFNNAVNKSKAEGFLKDFSDGVRGLGTEKLKQLRDILKEVWDAIKPIIPSIKQFSEAFSGPFREGISVALGILKEFFALLDGSGLAPYIGAVLGLAAGFKAVMIVVKPLWNILKVFGGAVVMFRGLNSAVAGLAPLFNFITGSSGRAGKAVTALANVIRGLGAAGLAVAAGFVFFENAKDNIKAFQDSVVEAEKHFQEFDDSLRNSFFADNGATGKNVFDTVSEQITTSIADIKSKASQVPGIWKNLQETWFGGGGANDPFGSGMGPFSFAQSKDFNDMQKASQDAAHAQKAFDRLGLSSQDLAGMITGSKDAFVQFNDTVRSSGEGGNEAADTLARLRAEFEQTQADFIKAGSGSVQLVKGIEAIAAYGGDATSKLEGLKQALQGLGLLQTSALDAAFEYAQSIREIASGATQFVDSTQPINDILDAQGNSYNVNSVNAQNLRNALKELSDGFLENAAQGKNVAEEYAKMEPAFEQLSQQFNIPIEKLKQLAALEGAIPDVVSILVNVKGGDKIGQQLAAIAAEAQTQAAGTEITVPLVPNVDKDKLKQALDAAFGTGTASINDNIVTIAPGVDPAALAKVRETLSQYGIAAPGVTPAPLPQPVQPEILPPKASGTTGNPVLDALTGNASAPGESQVPVTPTVDQAALDAANAKIQELKNKIDELSSASNGNKLSIDVSINGFDQVKTQLDSLKAILGTSAASWQSYQTAVGQVIGQILSGITNMVNTIASQFSSLQQNAYLDGVNAIRAFAQGIRDAIPDVASSAQQVAQTVNDYIHGRSPTKKGPLSGKGWAQTSGQKLVSAFASGIAGGTGATAGAASSVAGGAASALQGPFDFGAFLGRLKDLVSFGDHLVDIIGKVSDTVFDAFKMISTAFGGDRKDAENRFFGQHPGFVRDPNVSNQDIQRQREDDIQSRLSGAMGKTRRTSDSTLADLPGALGLKGQDNIGKEDIAAAIVGEANRRGYGRNTSIGAIAASMLESRMDPNITNASGHKGLFQMSADKNPGDAADQINWFFDQLDALGGPSKVEQDPLNIIADKVEKGGYPGSNYQQFTKEAADYVDSITGAFSQAIGTAATNVNPSNVKVTGRQGLTSVSESLLERVMQQFPEVANIGGVRNDPIPDHPSGRALDIMVGTDKELGDRINDWLRTNANALGIDSTIWRDTWADFQGNTSTVKGHQDHVHAKTVQPGDLTGLDSRAINDANPATHGRGAALGPDFSDFSSDELKQLNQTQGLSYQTEEQMLDQLRVGNSALDSAIRTGQDPNSTDDQVISSLSTIQQSIDQQGLGDTAAGRQQLQALDGIKSSIMGQRGIAEASNPIDTASTIASSATSVAKDIFGVINSTLDAVGAANDLGDTLVRGISNSEDIYNAVDQIQKFIDLGARIAGAVSSISGAAGAIAGAAGSSSGMPGGGGAGAALQGVSAISGLISGALDTVNGIIDLAQEAYRIAGTYFGEFLGFLTGGADQLQGDVRFLLDKNDGTLKAYSRDNPLDKREHALPGGRREPAGNGIGEINVYPERGADPAALTRQMMFAVKVSSMGTGALN